MILSFINQETELALQLYRLLDISKEDSKFLQTLYHAFQQELNKPRHLKLSAAGFILYLNRPCFWEILSLDAGDKLSRLD